MVTLTTEVSEGISLIAPQLKVGDDLKRHYLPRESLRNLGSIEVGLCERMRVTSGPARAQLAEVLGQLSKRDLGILEYLYVVNLSPEAVQAVMRHSGVTPSDIENVQQEIKRIARAKLGVSEELLQSLEERPKSGEEFRDQRIFASARRVAILIRLDSELPAEQISELKIGQVDLKAGELHMAGGKVSALRPLTVDEIETYLKDLAAVSARGWPLDPESRLILRQDALETLRIADCAEDHDGSDRSEVLDRQVQCNGSKGISRTAIARVEEAERRRTKKSQHPKGTELPKEPLESSQAGRTVAGNVLQLKRAPQISREPRTRKEIPTELTKLAAELEKNRVTGANLRLSDQVDFDQGFVDQLEVSMQRIETMISRGRFGSTPVVDGIKMEFGLIRVKLNGMANQPASNQPPKQLLSAAALIVACDNVLQEKNRSGTQTAPTGIAV